MRVEADERIGSERTRSGAARGATLTASLSSSSGVTIDHGVMHGVFLLLLQTTLVCVLIASGYFALPWLKLAFDKPIARVIVRGDLVALDQKTIMDAVAIYDADSFLDIDLAALVSRLESQPWITRARARRRWPDTVEIDIVEQRPIAYWGSNAMVNARGRIFEHQGLFLNRDLPHLWSEISTPAEEMGYYQIFDQQLQPLGIKLHAISQGVQGDWSLTLNNGMLLVLDRNDPVGNMRQFVSIYQQVLQSAPRVAQVVDMRYQHGAAIRWTPAPVELPGPEKKHQEKNTGMHAVTANPLQDLRRASIPDRIVSGANADSHQQGSENERG
ncbi:MAG TPA: FtsQ-type POTRA domain-containing protein [Pseudomonadales bacterium]|nr:FtsQ-type POTRA domain-containing protein [Pseudomonadales bacterium]